MLKQRHTTRRQTTTLSSARPVYQLSPFIQQLKTFEARMLKPSQRTKRNSLFLPSPTSKIQERAETEELVRYTRNYLTNNPHQQHFRQGLSINLFDKQNVRMDDDETEQRVHIQHIMEKARQHQRAISRDANRTSNSECESRASHPSILTQLGSNSIIRRTSNLIENDLSKMTERENQGQGISFLKYKKNRRSVI